MRKSKKILYFTFSFIIGIAFQELIAMPFFILYTLFIFSSIFLYFFWSSQKIRFIFIVLTFFVLGAVRMEVEEIVYTNNLSPIKEERFIGTVKSNAETYDSYKNIFVTEEKSKKRFLLRVNLFSEFFYGDKIEFTCLPQDISDKGSYSRYLKKEKISYLCYYPEVRLISESKSIHKKLFQLKEKGKKIIDDQVFYPQSGVLSAMILGYKKDIPLDLRENFSKIGVSHIVAISGMHLVIVSVILYWLLIMLGFWRQQAFYLIVFLLWLYIIMIGLPASAVRAGIMISIVLWGRHIGRVNNLNTTLFLVAAFILFFNPFFLLGDIGFQLSFLAVLGIIHLTPIFLSFLKKVKTFDKIKDILAVTFAAQIFTLPLAVFYFGFIPVLSLPVNLIFIPLLPIIFVLGALIILSGLFFPILSEILGIITGSILSFLVSLAEIFVELPFSFFYIEKINFLWIVGFYLFLFLFIYKIKKNNAYNELI
jgi:competence protein ComEC